MPGARAVALATVASAMGAACTFGINTSGLAGDGGADASSPDSTTDAPLDTRGLDGGPKDTGMVDGGEGDAMRHEAATGDTGADDVPIVPVSCTVPLVQAVPGTSVYQVMQNSPTSEQTIGLTAGSLLVAIAYGGQGPGHSTPLTTVPNMTFAVSDSLGNTYYAGPMIENAISHQASIQIFYAPNVAGGMDAVTATSADHSGVSLWTGLFLQEYSGIASTDVVDVSSGQMAPSSTTSLTPGTMTTATGCDLVVGAFTDGHVDGQNLGSGTAWFVRSTDDWDPAEAVDNAPGGSPPGSLVDAVMDLTQDAGDNGWVAAQMAFRAADTASLPQPDSIAFSTPPRTAGHSACSEIVTVQSRRASTPTNTATGMTLTLSGSGLTFYADPSCAYPITSLYIGAGTSSQSFYFEGPTAGSVMVTASASMAITATQTETVN